jgi:DNA primase
MNNSIPPEIIAEIRRRCDIVAIISRKVKLTPKGKEHIGLCPFHRDKNPSMYVNQALGVWLCRSCQAGGDIFKFVQRAENLTFPEAARALAALAGIEMPMSAEQKQQQQQRQRILSALAAAVEFYQRQ